MATHSSILAWRIPKDKRSLVGYSPRGHKKSDTKYIRSHFIKLYQNSSQGHVIAVDIFFQLVLVISLLSIILFDFHKHFTCTAQVFQVKFCIDICELPWCLSGKESACQCKRLRFDSWVRKIPWRRKQQPTPVFLLGNPMDRGAWRDTVQGLQRLGHNLVTKQQQEAYIQKICKLWIDSLIHFHKDIQKTASQIKT